jgi:excinuclease UvrABC helicase subunit UvrB
MKKTVSDALHSLVPDLEFVISNDSYESINFVNIPEGKDIPSKEEVEEEVKRLQKEYDNLEYQRLRKDEYPPIEDQLDMIYHQGIEGWKTEIDKVKNKYPKPEKL